MSKARLRKPDAKKAKTRRTLKKKTTQTGGFTETRPVKKMDSTSPFSQQKFRRVAGEWGGILRHVAALNCESERPGEKCARESPGSSSKRRPLRTKRLLALRAWGPCDPKPNTRNKTVTEQGGDQPSALEGLSLALTQVRGRARSPVLADFGEITFSGFEKTRAAAKQNKKGKTKPGTRSKETPLPPKRGLERGERAQAP